MGNIKAMTVMQQGSCWRFPSCTGRLLFSFIQHLLHPQAHALCSGEGLWLGVTMLDLNPGFASHPGQVT